MGNYEISCVVHDSNDVIIRVGIGGKLYIMRTVVDWILAKGHPFFTYKDDMRADLYARKHHTMGRWFLTTDPDDTRENNLDFPQKGS